MKVRDLLPWVLLVALAVSVYGGWRFDEARDAARVAAVKEQAAEWKQAAQEAADSANALRLVAEYWASAYEASAADARAALDRWNELSSRVAGPSSTDATGTTPTPSELASVGDSLAAACADALNGCATAIAAKDSAILAERSARFKQAERADSLEVLAVSLAGGESDPLWPTFLTVSAGCGLSFLTSEINCMEGASIGVSFDILRRGLTSLYGSIR